MGLTQPDFAQNSTFVLAADFAASNIRMHIADKTSL
jgi:hypothetical protein